MMKINLLFTIILFKFVSLILNANNNNFKNLIVITSEIESSFEAFNISTPSVVAFNIMRNAPKDFTWLIGQKFNMLTVVEEGPFTRKECNGKRLRIWVCKCDCGNEKTATLSQLRAGTVKSCGCIRRTEANRKRLSIQNTKHGQSFAITYRSWCSMIQRCNNPNHTGYEIYGGGGIKIDEKWLTYQNFYDDMGERPSKKHSLDRIDTEKGYFKENCKWSTALEQNRNKRNNFKVEYKGETKCISEWAEIYGIREDTLRFRIVESKWDIEKCLTYKVKDLKRKVVDLRTGIIYKSLRAATIALGLNYDYHKYHLNSRAVNETNLRYAED